jgi:YVTN family beta-propeller protein
MQRKISATKRAAPARGIAALWVAFMIGLGATAWPSKVMAWPKEVGPFVYALNHPSFGQPRSLAIIDTRTSQRVGEIRLSELKDPLVRVAVTPDGKRAYVGSHFSNTMAVINLKTNTLDLTIPVGGNEISQLAAPGDGKHIYASVRDAETSLPKLIAINTETNTVVSRMLPGRFVPDPAVSPDGKRVYVPIRKSGGETITTLIFDTKNLAVTAQIRDAQGSIVVSPDGRYLYFLTTSHMSVFNTATYTLETIRPLRWPASSTPVKLSSFGRVPISPDGKRVYIGAYANDDIFDQLIVAFDTATYAPTTGGYDDVDFVGGPIFSPDGKYAYFTSSSLNYAATTVIDTAANKEIATIRGYAATAIVPPPPGLPFQDFKLSLLDMHLGTTPGQSAFEIIGFLTLKTTDSNCIRPDIEEVRLTIDGVTFAFPPGSFKQRPTGSFTFHGTLQGATITAVIKPIATSRYAFYASGKGVTFTGTKNPVQATLIIGDDAGLASVNATLQSGQVIASNKAP